MGKKNDYMELVKLQEQLEERTKLQVTDKLNYLRTVGHSVIGKCYGTPLAVRLGHIDWFKPYDEWLKHTWDVKKLGEEFITLAKRTNPSETIQLNRALIHLSDRDFAKLIRIKVREHKAHLKEAEERKRLQTARSRVAELEDNLAKNTKQLAKDQEELEKLKALMA